MVIHCVSTRKVAAMTEELCGEEFSKSTVSELCNRLDPVVGFFDTKAVLELPERYRKRPRTTGGQERLNEEIRRRDRVIRIYPNRDLSVRLLGALLMEIDEKRQCGHRYFDMEDDYVWREERRKKEVAESQQSVRKIS